MPPHVTSLPTPTPPSGSPRAPGWATVLHGSFPVVPYFTHDRVHVNATLPTGPALFSPLCPQVHSPRLYLHSFPASRFIRTVLLDSIWPSQFSQNSQLAQSVLPQGQEI